MENKIKNYQNINFLSQNWLLNTWVDGNSQMQQTLLILDH